jgi:hypothetical protein
MQGLWEGGFSRYIDAVPEEPRRGVCESLKGSIALTIDVLFWFLLFIGVRYMYIQLFLAYWLCKIHWDFWILVVDHHSHLHCGFIWPQILSFERSVSLSPGHQSSLVLPAKFFLEALFARDDNVTLSPLLLQWKADWGLRYRIYLFACTVLFSSWNDDDKKNFSPEL